MNVPLNRDIRLAGDSAVNYQLVHAALKSLREAGFSTKVGVLTN